MKKTIILITLIITMSVLSGCETMKGLGKDIENTGNNIQKMLTND